ncbi:hypothetical protein, conserved [Babesia bigemina]|uniref:Uncharacterized protein n=1 Tax=Babesia bigemina TaxID=5866 RepID=A0A061D8T2_BABBI|nr:hypothetical protein, conserved [Babesia bigemina]CDR95289.1 hypothetical protein, conserved [Babesia bigemina]|eukprot:XP_012767475.1 hypothetical protein, conserved [Babesia bigemina]
MGWFIDRHLYYLHSEEYVSFLTLIHLCCMVLTGYGVVHHSADLNEIQNNVWAICLSSFGFLCNLCAIRGGPNFFYWYLPLTVLLSLALFFILSAYHGLLMVYMVHLPLVSFTLTGVPCILMVAVSMGALVLGIAFHTVLVSALYSEFHGHSSGGFMRNVTAWLRPPTARGFTIVMLDAYIVLIQIVIGIFCYQRYVKLGQLIAAYRLNPARYLGSFSSIDELEDDFLPPENPSADNSATPVKKLSIPMHHCPPEEAESAQNSDADWSKFEQSNLMHGKRRVSVEHIEPLHFQNLIRHGPPHVISESDGANQSSPFNMDLEEIRKHYKPKPGGYIESLLQSHYAGDGSRKKVTLNRTEPAAGGSPVESTPTASQKTRNVTWEKRDSTQSNEIPVVEEDKTDTVIPEQEGREYSTVRSAESATKHRLSFQSSKTTFASGSVDGEQENRSYVITALKTLRQFSLSSHGAITPDNGVVFGRKNDSKSWRNSYDELRSMTRSLQLDPALSYGAEKSLANCQVDGMRIGSFEGAGYTQRTHRVPHEAVRFQDGHARVLSPINLRTSACLSQMSWSHSDASFAHPTTSNATLNALIRVMPNCGYRVIVAAIRMVHRMSNIRELIAHYTWTQPPNMPGINGVGFFAHTRIESWYVDWMHEFNMTFYKCTINETMLIFVLAMLSDILVVVRLYNTLEVGPAADDFFSTLRIVLLTLRYVAYPAGMMFSLCHLKAKGVTKNAVFYNRSLVMLCLGNMILTFIDLWSCLDIFKAGFALHNSLYACSAMTTTSLMLFTRPPILLGLFGISVFSYGCLLYLAGNTVGWCILELVSQLVVAAGCLMFFVRPIDTNRRKLFCLYTLPYLFYLEAMRS